MKTLAPGLQAHLDSGTTTLCWCWRLTRRDGSRLGFTDHDRDVVLDGTTFEAAAGFTASQMKDTVGLSVDNLEVESALSSGRLSADDLAAGLYDNARVELWRVNWSDAAQRVLLRAGSLGEVRRTGLAFTAEVRGLSNDLQQPGGRLYQYSCDADLGDRRCRIDLALSGHRSTGTVVAIRSPRGFVASGLDGSTGEWFTRGLLRFTTGANAATAIEIKQHGVAGGVVVIELWQQPAAGLAIGDAFQVTAGCDKQFATCRDKFANGQNFRGFPHMPGNDFISTVARSG